MDVGYGADDPALLLTHWKFYLRSITNAIIDTRIHTAGMTEDEAVRYMVDGGFQEEAEARAKYRPRPAVLDAAVDLLRRLDGDVGDRAGGAPPRGRRRRRRPGRDRRGRAAGRVRRDAGLPLSRPPRGGHLARRTADVAAASGSCSTELGLVRRSVRALDRGRTRRRPVARSSPPSAWSGNRRVNHSPRTAKIATASKDTFRASTWASL